MLLGGFLAFPVQAGEKVGAEPAKTKPAPDPTRLTFKDVFGGGRKFTKPIPRWSLLTLLLDRHNLISSILSTKKHPKVL